MARLALQVVSVALALVSCALAAKRQPLTVADCKPKFHTSAVECATLVSFCKGQGIDMKWYAGSCPSPYLPQKGCQCLDRCPGSKLNYFAPR